jgi:hypothetical protein
MQFDVLGGAVGSSSVCDSVDTMASVIGFTVQLGVGSMELFP